MKSKSAVCENPCEKESTKGVRMITQNELKSILKYDAKSGLFTWKMTKGRARKGNVAGNKHQSGYISIMYKGKAYQAHRLAWLYEYGEMPEGEIDHINQIKDDNRIDNLRDVDRATNAKNMPQLTTNKSGYTGISWSKSKKRWRATIGIEGKQFHLGYYAELEDAIKARRREEKFEEYSPIHGK